MLTTEIIEEKLVEHFLKGLDLQQCIKRVESECDPAPESQAQVDLLQSIFVQKQLSSQETEDEECVICMHKPKAVGLVHGRT